MPKQEADADPINSDFSKESRPLIDDHECVIVVRRRASNRSFPIIPRATRDRFTLWDRSNIVIVARIEHNDDIRKALYRVREWVIVKRLAAASLALSLSRPVSLSLPVFHPFSIPSGGTPAGNPPPFNSLLHSSHSRARPYFRLPSCTPSCLTLALPAILSAVPPPSLFHSTPCAIHAVPSAVVAPSGAV